MAAKNFHSRNIAMSLVGNFFPPLAVLVTAPILARQLGVDGRGELAAATAPFLLAVAIGTFGLPDAVTNALARNSRLRSTGWFAISSTLAVAGFSSVALTAWASPMLASGGSDGLATVMTIATVATIPGLLVALLRGTAAGEHRWGVVALERILNGTLRVSGIVVLAAVDQLTLVTATGVTVIAPVCAGAAYLLLIKQPAHIDPPEATPLRRVFAFGTRAWLGSVAGILLMRVDQLLVLPLAGSGQLGLYSVAVNVSEVPLIINSATREVMFSSDAAERDNARAAIAARTTFIACAVFSLLVFSPIEWWLPLLFGEEFRAAIPMALVAVVAVLVGVPGSIAGASVSARGRPGLRSLSILAACLANVALIFVLVPTLGGTGAAIATLAGNLISSNMCIAFAVRLHGFTWRDFYGIRWSDFAAIVRAVTRSFGRP